jgi:outer membrane protein TolC
LLSRLAKRVGVKWLLAALAGLILTGEGAALAQAPAPAPAPAPGPAAEQPLPTTRRPSTPAIDDPMLAAPPPPRRLVTSWSEAVSNLRAQSTDLRIAIDQVLQAEALTRGATAKYLPSLTGTGRWVHQIITRTGPLTPVAVMEGVVQSTTAPIPNTLTGTLTLTQTLLDAEAFDQIGIARLAERASRLSVADKRRTLALGVANAIVSVVMAEHTAEINRVGLRVALEQLQLTRQRKGLGGGTALDEARAEQNAELARAALVAGDETLRVAREALGLALGFPEETGVAPDLKVDGIAADVMQSCRPVGTLEDRPDVAAARAQLDVAKRRLRNVWLGFLPTVTAQSDLVATTAIPMGFPNPIWDIQALLTVPIWDGGARYATLHAANAAADIAQEELVALRRQDQIQVEQAERELVVAEDADKVARRLRDVAAKTEALTEYAFVAGQATSLELVTASEAHREAELNVVVKDSEIVKARLAATLALSTCSW